MSSQGGRSSRTSTDRGAGLGASQHLGRDVVTTGVDGHLDQPTDALVPLGGGLCSPWKEGPWGGSLLGLRRSGRGWCQDLNKAGILIVDRG